MWTLTIRACTAALALTVALTGCTALSRAEPALPAGAAPTLDGTAWTLAALPGATLVPGASVTLQFEGGRVTGSDGCNRYTGAYTANGPALEIPAQLASTMMACAPDVSAQAKAYVAALTGARTFRIVDGRLELLGADGSVRATLAPQSRALAGSSWEALNINNGRQAVVGLVQGTTLTLEFGTDGQASGSAGCNRFITTWRADGNALTFTPPAGTRRLCADPPGVMEQEQSFLQALTTVAEARVEGDGLELRTADGALAASFTRARR